jgi:hypothetical protein
MTTLRKSPAPKLPEICCSGNCLQGDVCPQFRPPQTSAERAADWSAGWIVAVLLFCAAVWGLASFGDSLRAWLGWV